MANLKQWDACEKLCWAFWEWRIPRKDKVWFSGDWPDRSPGSPHSWDWHTRRVLQVSARWLHGEKPIQQKGPGPCLGASRCSVTFPQTSPDGQGGAGGRCSSQLRPLIRAGPPGCHRGQAWLQGRVRVWNFSKQRKQGCALVHLNFISSKGTFPITHDKSSV